MNLTLADVSQTLSPLWAQIINAALQGVDLHDHTQGNGAKITPAGLTINSDLDLVNNRLLNILAAALVNVSILDTSKAGSLQRIGTNLWWVNSAGAGVQITSGTSVVSTGSGALSVSVPSGYPYNVVVGDAQKVLTIDTSSARTLNLPAASNVMYFIIKDGTGSAQTNNITVVPNGADLIDGINGAFVIYSNYGALPLISDGVSKWYVV